METSFNCTMCGQCCTGKGGIVVSRSDLRRLCKHLGLSAEEFESAWGERRGSKLHIRSGRDLACVFFRPRTGCSVHEAKPDICRAWPYFRGNLVDAESFALAKDFCPGIAPDAEFAVFVREGLAYLRDQGLAGSRGSDEAGALQVDDLLAACDSAENTGSGAG